MVRTAFIALMAIVTAATATAQTVLTVDDAVAVALANNRRIANTGLEVEKASQDLLSARTRRLPQVSIEAQMSQLVRPIDVFFPQGTFGEYPGIGPVPATDTSLRTAATPTYLFSAQATQPLSQLYRIGLDIKLSEASQALEREVARASRITLQYRSQTPVFLDPRDGQCDQCRRAFPGSAPRAAARRRRPARPEDRAR